MLKNIYHKSAFSLIELILVVVLISISAGVVAPIYYSAKKANDLNTSLYTLVSSLRRAQLLSMAVYLDDNWGLKINNNEILIFKGNNFLSRDLDYDEVVSVNRSIVFTGLDELVYSKLTGRPNIDGDIFLTLDNNTLSLNINSLGLIDY